jgi:hypothetical protein
MRDKAKLRLALVERVVYKRNQPKYKPFNSEIRLFCIFPSLLVIVSMHNDENYQRI